MVLKNPQRNWKKIQTNLNPNENLEEVAPPAAQALLQPPHHFNPPFLDLIE